MNWRWRFCRPLPYHLAMPPIFWSGRRDLNPRLQPWQGCTLPLSYSRSKKAKLRFPSKPVKLRAAFPDRAHAENPAPAGVHTRERTRPRAGGRTFPARAQSHSRPRIRELWRTLRRPLPQPPERHAISLRKRASHPAGQAGGQRAVH